MSDLNLYLKISSLPYNLKNDVSEYIDFLKYKRKQRKTNNKRRIAGKAKGLINIHKDFDEPIPGFNKYKP